MNENYRIFLLGFKIVRNKCQNSKYIYVFSLNIPYSITF